MPNNSRYSIENCGQDCHVFCDIQDTVVQPEYDYNTAPEEEVVESEYDYNTGPENEDVEPEYDHNTGPEDEKTNITTISVIFYYTDMFEDANPDLKGFIDNLIESTNLAYVVSDMPISLEFHNMVKVPYPEVPEKDSTERLQEWKESQPSQGKQDF